MKYLGQIFLITCAIVTMVFIFMDMDIWRLKFIAVIYILMQIGDSLMEISRLKTAAFIKNILKDEA